MVTFLCAAQYILVAYLFVLFLGSAWNLSFPTRGQTRTACSGSMES